MSKEKQLIPFRLISISTEDFETKKEEYDRNKPFDLNFGFHIELDVENKVLSVFTLFDFEQKDSTFLSLMSGCHFEIFSTFWKEQIEGKKISFPASLITHLLVICVGTARGIIHEIKPNWAENVILPTLNISEAIKEDLFFELEEKE